MYSLLYNEALTRQRQGVALHRRRCRLSSRSSQLHPPRRRRRSPRAFATPSSHGNPRQMDTFCKLICHPRGLLRLQAGRQFFTSNRSLLLRSPPPPPLLCSPPPSLCSRRAVHPPRVALLRASSVRVVRLHNSRNLVAPLRAALCRASRVPLRAHCLVRLVPNPKYVTSCLQSGNN